MNNKTIWKILSVILALGLWQLAAMTIGMDILLVSPLKVAARLGTIWLEPGFWSSVLFTLLRILMGFFIAFFLGTVLAVAAGRWQIVDILLWPYIITFKAVPIASFIIICLIWLTYGQLTVVIAFLIAFPVIYTNVLEGIRSADKGLLEMADVYRLPWIRRFTHIYTSAVKPFIISASRTAIGMSFKAGIAAEVIGVVKGSIGEKLYEARIYFQSADLFAWTVVIILLAFIIEKVFVFVLRQAYAGVERL